MSEVADVVQEAVERGKESRLNSYIALLVAITAVMMALCNVKDANVVQAMSQAQAHTVDAWSFFQSKSTKQHIAENMADQLEVQLLFAHGASADVRGQVAARMIRCRRQVMAYGAEKDSLQKQAQGFAGEYDRLNVHDDQFDMADATLSISIALYGITALTRRRWLFVMALLATLFGAFWGACGFVGASYHPSWLMGWLG